jgi:hypothetical protein
MVRSGKLGRSMVRSTKEMRVNVMGLERLEIGSGESLN